ncbi:hypothetical protein TIFTF001_000805 [Ficus carica]|uniref:Uncharacterized protein n=1 Tax=Ficus carica TaxID=3494 RepID=A0AA87Z4F1_FICCA|nr:hypothetical protein TIFTF001_000805 [Ficus carica]
MAISPDNRLCSTRAVLRTVLVVFCVCLVGYSTVPMWLEENSNAQGSCPHCLCDCSSEDFIPMPSEFIVFSLEGIVCPFTDLMFIPIARLLVAGFLDISVADCGKDIPELYEEMRKDVVTLTVEELELRKTVANETLEHTRALISDARKATSHYQKEAEKCNVGVETCEEAREIAEAQLVEERRLSALWEERARELGWKPDRRLLS